MTDTTPAPGLIRCKDGRRIVIAEIETFSVIDSPGYRDNGMVSVRFKSGRHLTTDLYESEFMEQWR